MESFNVYSVWISLIQINIELVLVSFFIVWVVYWSDYLGISVNKRWEDDFELCPVWYKILGNLKQ